MLVWHAARYYTFIADVTAPDVEFKSDVSFYVVPTFGHVTIVPNIEYKQIITIAFDSNSDADHDPYGSKITKYISNFVNNNAKVVEKYGNEVSLTSGRTLYITLESISEPIYSQSKYVRKVVTIALRYCSC